MPIAKQELSAKKQLLQSLLKCPHRDLSQTIPVFSQALKDDPLFTGKCFYALTLREYNQIRDLGEAGISFLLTSPHPEHRTAGRILFQALEPYRAYRAGKFIRNDLKGTNRQAKGAVEDYLRKLEKDQRRFDGAVLVAKKPLHHLYEYYHVKPSQRAQTILFDNEVPEGEINLVRLLKEAKTPEEQALRIIENKIPYRVATSVLKGMTPAIWVALIDVMTPIEAVNARASVEKSGILEDAKIRKLYESKLKKAEQSDKVSVSHLSERQSSKGKDEQLEKIVQETRQKKIDKSAKITCDTQIAVDCSGSMEAAITVAKKLCPMVASICEGNLRIDCFNDTAWVLASDGKSLQDYEKAFKLIRADGATCLGSALQLAIAENFIPEQCVFITDQGENRRPPLAEVYADMLKKGVGDPRFILVTLRGTDQTDKIARELEQAGADVVSYELNTLGEGRGWFDELTNVIPLLTKGGYAELINRIMKLELPA